MFPDSLWAKPETFPTPYRLNENFGQKQTAFFERNFESLLTALGRGHGSQPGAGEAVSEGGGPPSALTTGRARSPPPPFPTAPPTPPPPPAASAPPAAPLAVRRIWTRGGHAVYARAPQFCFSFVKKSEFDTVKGGGTGGLWMSLEPEWPLAVPRRSLLTALDDAAACAVCKEVLSVPLVLPCGHSCEPPHTPPSPGDRRAMVGECSMLEHSNQTP